MYEKNFVSVSGRNATQLKTERICRNDPVILFSNREKRKASIHGTN